MGRFSQYKQKALGRQNLTFTFDIIPYSVGTTQLRRDLKLVAALCYCKPLHNCKCCFAVDVPTQVSQVSFVLERGSKVQYTDAAAVDTERRAYWQQVLKLVRFQQAKHQSVVAYLMHKQSKHLPGLMMLCMTAALHVDGHHVKRSHQNLAERIHTQGPVRQVQ